MAAGDVEQLLRSARLWRAANSQPAASGIATGYPELDRCLAAGGWPPAALSEILLEQPGCGELKLVMPALASLSQGERWLMWIAPPHIPYAPALAAAGVNLDRTMVVHANKVTDTLWAAEQSLRSGNCAAVLMWIDRAADKTLRRLQLAAAEGDSCGLVFRSERVADESSPAALRLLLGAQQGRRTLRILKNRGGRQATLDAGFLAP